MACMDARKWLEGLEIKIACVADLLLVEDEEDTPYKSKYAAIDILQELIDQGDVISGQDVSRSGTACTAAGSDLAASEGPQHPPPTRVRLEAAKLRARRGIIMMDTDLRGDGEQCLLQALPVLESAPTQITEVQECWNTLGALHSSRGSFDVAIVWLHKAEALYEAERTHGQQGQSSLAPTIGAGSPPAPSAPQPDVIKLEAQYTSTVFFLAQVHSHAGNKDSSALYCAKTLQRQLDSGTFPFSEWVQNCMQLAGYYVGNHVFPLAEHCLRAAQAVAARATPPERIRHPDHTLLDTPPTPTPSNSYNDSGSHPSGVLSLRGSAAGNAASSTGLSTLEAELAGIASLPTSGTHRTDATRLTPQLSDVTVAQETAASQPIPGSPASAHINAPPESLPAPTTNSESQQALSAPTEAPLPTATTTTATVAPPTSTGVALAGSTQTPQRQQAADTSPPHPKPSPESCEPAPDTTPSQPIPGAPPAPPTPPAADAPTSSPAAAAAAAAATPGAGSEHDCTAAAAESVPAAASASEEPAAASSKSVELLPQLLAQRVDPPPRPEPAVDLDGRDALCLDEDVAANMELAWAKLLLHKLQASSDALGGRTVEMSMTSPDQFPEFLRFRSLPSLPSPESYAWGRSALATDFASARELFNPAMAHFKKALEYYLLDGWVTEHIETLMDQSNLYRCLAAFEPDVHRRCVMHKARANILAPLHKQLNPQYYLGTSRSVDLELGNIYREILDLKDGAGWAPGKVRWAECPHTPSPAHMACAGTTVAAAGLCATKFYQSFIDSFRKDGKLPDRVDEDNERFFLMASFNMGRVLHKASFGDSGGPKDIEALLSAQRHLRWSADYVTRHKLESYQREAALAQELALLLAEKVQLLERLAGGGSLRNV
ncbi:MAG: hypothetical protein WDW36_006468 [Sanguina aurantia]